MNGCKSCYQACCQYNYKSDHNSILNYSYVTHNANTMTNKNNILYGGANQHRNVKKRNAIFMMCVINETYVIGACIAGYCHRKMLENANLKDTTDLVIMCDENIYEKYHKLLRCDMFFDRVEKIDLRIFKDSPKYIYSKAKYSLWIGASLNKWQIMKYDEYDKIMFVDIALLPSKTSLYDLFDRQLPLMLIRKENSEFNDPKDLKCIDGQKINTTTENITYDDYLENEQKYGTIHGNLVVLKPSKIMYDEYVKLTDTIYKNGIYSIYKSGPDETSLFYYFIQKGIDVFSICHENANIPWDEHILIDIAKGYEFSSMVKPWIKPKILCWPEEILWRDIYELIIKKMLMFDRQNINTGCSNQTINLRELFKKTILNTYKQYMNSDSRTQKRNYNDKFVKRFQNDFDKLKHINNDNELFEALMRLDSKIYVKYYGSLKTDKLISVL